MMSASDADVLAIGHAIVLNFAGKETEVVDGDRLLQGGEDHGQDPETGGDVVVAVPEIGDDAADLGIAAGAEVALTIAAGGADQGIANLAVAAGTEKVVPEIARIAVLAASLGQGQNLQGGLLPSLHAVQSQKHPASRSPSPPVVPNLSPNHLVDRGLHQNLKVAHEAHLT